MAPFSRLAWKKLHWSPALDCCCAASARSYWARVISLEARPASNVATTAITTGVALSILPHCVWGISAFNCSGICTFMMVGSLRCPSCRRRNVLLCAYPPVATCERPRQAQTDATAFQRRRNRRGKLWGSLGEALEWPWGGSRVPFGWLGRGVGLARDSLSGASPKVPPPLPHRYPTVTPPLPYRSPTVTPPFPQGFTSGLGRVSIAVIW